MALIKDRMFLYPVLCDFKDDYIGVQFLTISEGAMLESYDHKTLSVNFFIKLDECNLLSLIEDKRAELLVLCYCSSTKYREIFPLKLGKNALELKSSDVNKMLELAPILVAKQPIPNFYSRNFNVDYKDTKFNIESGNILAIGNQKKIFVEKEINDMTVINSVITIVQGDEDDVPMQFEYDADRIRIILPKSAYEKYQDYSSVHLSIINSLIIVPALTGILSDIIKNGSIDDDVCNKRWFRQISRTVKKYDNAELDYDYIVSKEPIILAQQLIGTPINDAMTEIQNISLGDDD